MEFFSELSVNPSVTSSRLTAHQEISTAIPNRAHPQKNPMQAKPSKTSTKGMLDLHRFSNRQWSTLPYIDMQGLAIPASTFAFANRPTPPSCNRVDRYNA
jgi:hypothetical protein